MDRHRIGGVISFYRLNGLGGDALFGLLEKWLKSVKMVGNREK